MIFKDYNQNADFILCKKLLTIFFSSEINRYIKSGHLISFKLSQFSGGEGIVEFLPDKAFIRTHAAVRMGAF